MPRKALYDPGVLTPEIAADAEKLSEFARANVAWKKHLAGGVFRQRTETARQTLLAAVAEAVAKVEEAGNPVRTLTIRLTPGGLIVHPLKLKFKDSKPRGPMSDEQKAKRTKATVKAKKSKKSKEHATA